MRVFLSGPMGVGKSTLASAVAARLGLRTLDLDARIEARAQQPIPAIFAQRGEPVFRALERDAVASLVAEDDVVVSLGGGTVVDDESRRLLLRSGVLITLRAQLATLVERVGEGAGRPLLGPDPTSTLAMLQRARAAAYAECHGSVWTDGEEDAVEAIVRIATERPVAVPLGTRSYVVEVGAGVRARLRSRIAAYGTPIVVADTNTAQWAEDLGGVQVVLDAGEENKNVDAVARIWDAALAHGVDRDSIVIAVGGGVVGDLAGFAAATLLRGVAFAQVPTSLLAMVDSSVGGKTGFNRAAGKNLVGSFHQPRVVLCDTDTLQTLPEVERIAGLAEVIKSAWLDDERAVAALEADAEALRRGEPGATAEAIRRSVQLKAAVVEADEREQGRRMVLNLGHTLGHAIEAAGGYGAIRHGEAVSLGLVAAARLAVRRGVMAPASAARLRSILDRLGLPTNLDAHLSDSVFGFLTRDKKRVGDAVRFVLPGEPGVVRIEAIPFDEVTRLVQP